LGRQARGEVDDDRHVVGAEQHGAEELGVHDLRGEPDRRAVRGELGVERAAHRGLQRELPFAERARGRTGEQVVAAVEQARPLDPRPWPRAGRSAADSTAS
jgi:hypothetical protein